MTEFNNERQFTKRQSWIPQLFVYTDYEGHEFGEAYRYRNYMQWADVCSKLVGGEIESASRYISGDEEVPALGSGLDFKGVDLGIHAIGILPIHVENFVQRVQAYRAGYNGVVFEVAEEGFKQRQPTEIEIHEGRGYLLEQGFKLDTEELLLPMNLST